MQALLEFLRIHPYRHTVWLIQNENHPLVQSVCIEAVNGAVRFTDLKTAIVVINDSPEHYQSIMDQNCYYPTEFLFTK